MKRAQKDKASPAEMAPPNQDEARRLMEEHQKVLRLTRNGPTNPDTKAFCGAFASLDVDNSWDLVKFKSGFSINITHLSEELVTFDMMGIDPPLANAFRRILIAEVPSVAISQVTMYQNTGVIHDENLAHRMGLIPFRFEPDNLEWRPPDAEFNEANSLRFRMHVACTKGKRAVYSKDLKWQPWSDAQEAEFKDDPPRPVEGNILIAQLGTGQEIECDVYLEKGVGKEHAKWSPVCTAFYRLMPLIELREDIVGEEAVRLKDCCPKGVFDIEDIGGVSKAVVKNPRACSTCRECIESFPGDERGLFLAKEKNTFLFSIESTGCMPAPELFRKGLRKLQEKCETAVRVLESRSEMQE